MCRALQLMTCRMACSSRFRIGTAHSYPPRTGSFSLTLRIRILTFTGEPRRDEPTRFPIHLRHQHASLGFFCTALALSCTVLAQVAKIERKALYA